MTERFDARKNRTNTLKHGASFAQIATMDWSTAITIQDQRMSYGEDRFITYAMIQNRLYCLVWTLRDQRLRPISLRKANLRERKKYEKEKNIH
jgi:uncharacterized protein